MAIDSQTRHNQLKYWAMLLADSRVCREVIHLPASPSSIKCRAEPIFETPPDPIPATARYSQNM